MIEVGENFNGRQVELAVGEIVDLSLAENPTTGFRWNLKTTPDPVCSLVKSAFEPAAGAPGKGGTHRWQFRALRPGVVEIELEYRRPWERENPPTRTFKLGVRVRKEPGSSSSTPPSE